MPLESHSSVVGSVHNPANPLITPLTGPVLVNEGHFLRDARLNIARDRTLHIPLKDFKFKIMKVDVSKHNTYGITHILGLNLIPPKDFDNILHQLNISEDLRPLINQSLFCTSIKIWQFNTEQEIREYEQTCPPAISPLPSNGYIKHKCLNELKDKSMKRLDQLNSHVSVPHDLMFQIVLQDNELVNSGLREAGRTDTFKDAIKKGIIKIFALPSHIRVRI